MKTRQSCSPEPFELAAEPGVVGKVPGLSRFHQINIRVKGSRCVGAHESRNSKPQFVSKIPEKTYFFIKIHIIWGTRDNDPPFFERKRIRILIFLE